MAAERKPSFFKVLQGDQFSTKVKVPSDFLSHFDGKVPEQCRLRICTRTWLVDVEMVDHKIYFENGWKEFVQENRLKGGEFLVFHYDGYLEFYVHIFGENACKKEFAEVAWEGSDSLKSRYSGYSRDKEDTDSDDASVEILDDFPPCYQSQYVGSTSGTKRFVQPKDEFLGRMHIDDDDDDIQELDSEEEDNDSEEDEESKEDENEAGSEDYDDFENEDSSEGEEDSDGDEGKSDDSIEILDVHPRFSNAKSVKKSSGLLKRKLESVKAKAQSSRMRTRGSSSNQKSTEWKYKVPKNMSGSKRIGDLIARHRANDFISKLVKPACLIAMSPSYIHGSCVQFPCDFAIKHLGKDCGHIYLRIKRKTWCLGIYYVHHVVRMQAGWNRFLNATNLKEGDVCVFELTDSNRYVFDVKIFRTTEPENCTLPVKGKTGFQFKSRK